MPRTPETLRRHELIGLWTEVVDSSDPTRIGIAGRVRDETAQTLVVEGKTRDYQVPKAEATFCFRLPDESAGGRETPGTTSEPNGEAVAYVTVDGRRLLSRPAERTELRGDTQWESV